MVSAAGGFRSFRTRGVSRRRLRPALQACLWLRWAAGPACL